MLNPIIEFISSADCQPNVWPSTCLLDLQGRLKLTKYYVKYLSVIYEYLPIENNEILVNNSLILLSWASILLVNKSK